MKYIAVLLIAGVVYLSFLHRVPVVPAAGQSQSGAPGTDFLKAPLDRTHEVMQQARVRADDPALK